MAADLGFWQRFLGNDDAAKLLYINTVGGRSFLGIRGSVKEFRALGDRADLVGMLVQDTSVVEFGLTSQDLADWGGGVTHPPGKVGNENLRVLVNPGQIALGDSFLREGPGRAYFDPGWTVHRMTLDIAAAHELGHAWGWIVNTPSSGMMSPGTNYGALVFENRARSWYGGLGPANAPRRQHSGILRNWIWP